MKRIIDFGELKSDGDKFEHIVCRLLERKGFKLIRHRATGPDKGRDLIFEENLQSRLLHKKRRWVIQCKLTASNVSWDKIDDIEKTMKCYEADSYLLVVSKDITEKLMDYLEKCSNSFDVTRWTYHELEEELLSNLDLFGEFFPISYFNYIGLWQGTDIDVSKSLEKTKYSFSKFNEWDSTRRWWTYHTQWFSGELIIKTINRENTIILANSKNANNAKFGIALYGVTQGNAFRNLNITRPSYISFSYMNNGDFACNLQLLGEDRNIYYLAYYTSDLPKDPHVSQDLSNMKYGNYFIGGSKSKNRYCKVERLVAKDLLRLFGVAPLMIDRICFSVSNRAKIKSLIFRVAN